MGARKADGAFSPSAAAQTTSAARPDTARVVLLANELKRRTARQALWGAGASLIPLPLIDWAVDAALLSKILNEIHHAFGLSPQQINALDASKRQRTYAAIQYVGNRVMGRVVTRAVVTTCVKGLGLKLTAQQLSKAVPIAGQVASAVLNYTMLRMVVNRHIDDCVRVLELNHSSAPLKPSMAP